MSVQRAYLQEMLDLMWRDYLKAKRAMSAVRYVGQPSQSLTYLASPYTHADKEVRRDRYMAACKAAAKLMLAGEVVFAPIAHSHPIEAYFDKNEGHDFWMRQDAPYLEACSKLVVLTIDGWDKSSGVAHEIRRAVERGIPIEYLAP